MSYFDLKIVTPTKSIDFESVNYVRCPGLKGLFGIMSNHQKGIFALDIGEIKVDNKKSSSFYSTSGGYACLLYTSPSPRDRTRSRMPSSA